MSALMVDVRLASGRIVVVPSKTDVFNFEHEPNRPAHFIKLEMSRNAAPPGQVLRPPATESTGFFNISGG
jgi:hypothetical protein